LVFLLLDTTRADRFGAWGNPAEPTPNLDALARSGIRFGRHFANAHATRSSMPQLLTGRYFHASVLLPFRSNDHPREFPFVRPDPTARLLTATLRDAGYRVVGASAHAWVVAESPFGATFDQLEFLPSPIEDGHASAAAVVDRGIELWTSRPTDRPTALYLHFMDAHMPRPRPAGSLEDRAGERFRKDGEPRFDRDRRRWRRSDARDFTDADRAHFRARYDALLSYMDGQIGRLLATLRADDPTLDQTLVVVVADHGENLGEDGLIDHADDLTDGVQHIPWIVAGAGVAPGQTTDRFTENIDVVPTVLQVLGIAAPAGVRTDGVAQVGPEGTICRTCAKRAAYFAWEDYLGVRTRHRLLRRRLPGSLRAHCGEAEEAFTLSRGARIPIRDEDHHLGRLLDHRLVPLDRKFRADRYGPPRQAFTMHADFWVLPDAAALACAELGVDTRRSSLDHPGWLSTGRGVTAMQGEPDAPLRTAVGVPDATYALEVAVVDLEPMPLFFGFAAWLDRFRAKAPLRHVALGDVSVRGGVLSVGLPPDTGVCGHVIGLRLSPTGRPASAELPADSLEDPELEERLRILGYVE